MKYSFKKSFMFVLTILALTFSALRVTPVYAASIVVNNNADDTLINLAANGFCDLREAIEAANTNVIVDSCASGAVGADTITFDATLSGGTIYLTSTLTLTQDVTIDGSALASKITISGDTDNSGTGDVRVFYVNPSVAATLNSLIITKGAITSFFGMGGGIYNAGTLTVTNSTLWGNSATGFGGGIYNSSGTLIVMNSTFSDNQGGFGGGIHNAYGTLTVTNSTLSGNSSYSGSGIYNVVGTLTVTNSTLSNNSATNNGGGIYNSSSMLTVTNSTLSGNSAAAAAGGGIYNNFGTLSYANTIIANSSGGDCVNSGGTIGTNTGNLVEDNSCSSSLSGDPSLGALASNGGTTQTFALSAGSSAIDAGDNTVCAAFPVNNLDQRGVIRPQGAQCDIGSYEALTVSMSSIATNPTNGSPIAVTVTFNGSVTGFTSSDITPGNGTVSAFAAVTGTTYTFDLTPATDGSVTADITAGVAQNSSGAGNIAAAQFSRTYDTNAPTVSMSSTATDPANASPIAVTVTFNESITGFDSSDITPGNGAVSNFAAVNVTTYTFDLTPAGQGLVTADIAAGVATDSAGNDNTIASQFSRTYATVYNLFLPLILR